MACLQVLVPVCQNVEANQNQRNLSTSDSARASRRKLCIKFSALSPCCAGAPSTVASFVYIFVSSPYFRKMFRIPKQKIHFFFTPLKLIEFV